MVAPTEYTDAKEWMLLFLSRQGPHTVAEMVDQSPYKRATLFDAARALTADGTLAKYQNRLHVLVMGDTHPATAMPAMATASAGSPAQSEPSGPTYGTPSPYAQGQH